MKEELQDNIRIFKSLGEIYSSMYYIDIQANHFMEVTSEPIVRKQVGVEGNAQEALDYFALQMLAPKYADEMLPFVNLSTLEQRLGANKLLTKEFSSTLFLGQGDIIVENWRQASFIDAGRDEEGHLTHAIFCTRSIHEEKVKALEQRKALADALEQAEQANKAKTTFLSNMSHDIRTPLNAIVGFTALATKHVNDPSMVREYLTKIATSSNHLLSLINDVLDMSRIEAGKVRLEEKDVHLPEVFKELQTIIQSDIVAKRMEFVLKTDTIRDEDVICDKLRLNQILLNLLSNAIKYTNPGGRVSLLVTQKENKNSGREEYLFTVSDNGIGMNEEFLRYIFKPFERMHSSTISGIQGTGLGLCITKNFVEMMGGTITVTSEEGLGSTFTVTLPFKKGKANHKGSCDMAASESFITKNKHTSCDFTGKKVLLVEDNMLNREIALELLEEAGFVVETAEDGDIAVDMLREATEGQYDLVLMDVQMPRLDGYTATREIRTLDNPFVSNIPIIAMTANAFEEDKRQAFEAGMSQHIPKPLNIPNLMEVLSTVLAS